MKMGNWNSKSLAMISLSSRLINMSLGLPTVYTVDLFRAVMVCVESTTLFVCADDKRMV